MLKVEFDHQRTVIAAVAPLRVGSHLDRFELRHPRLGHEAAVNVKAALLLPTHVERVAGLGALSLAVMTGEGADRTLRSRSSTIPACLYRRSGLAGSGSGRRMGGRPIHVRCDSARSNVTVAPYAEHPSLFQSLGRDSARSNARCAWDRIPPGSQLWRLRPLFSSSERRFLTAQSV